MGRDVYKELAELKAQHKRAKVPKLKVAFPNLKCRDEPHQLSNTIEGRGGFKRDIRTDHKWRRDSQEKAEIVKEIERKAKRIRLNTSKGAYQYNDDSDRKGPITVHLK